MAFKRLSGLDTVFLAAESPGNWLHVMAVLILDPRTVPGGYSFDRFRDYVKKRLHLIPPMRRRLVEVPFGLATPIWVDDPDLDVDRHLRRAAVPAPGGPAELAKIAGEMMERPLDRSRPLWEISMVEGVEGGHIALLAKLHHSMMDGMAGMQFMAALLSREPDVSDPDPAEVEPAEPIPSDWRMLVDAAPQIVGRPLRIARAGAETIGRMLRYRLREEPEEEDERPAVEVKRMWLNAPTTPERTISFTSLPLDRARAIAHANDATVNDVILAVVGGALRRELDRRGELPDAPLVAGVPVSTHEEGDDLANAVSVIYVGLGTQIADPLERLHEIRDTARQAKKRQGSLGGKNVNYWTDAIRPYEMGFVVGLIRDLGLLHHLPPLCNVVVSNIPGPPVPLYLAGARLLGIYPMGPIFDGMGLNITVLSREDETLDFGLVALGRLIRDPWPLADALTESLEELAQAAGASDRAAG